MPLRLLRSPKVRFGLLVALVGAFGLLMLVTHPSRQSLIAAVQHSHVFAPAVAVGGSALLVTALAPRTALAFAGGALFGATHGTGYVLIGVTLGSTAAFLLGRLLGRDFVAKRVRGRAALIERAVARKGIFAVIVSRMVPLVPFGISNYVFGTTKVCFRRYVAGTLLGAAPATLAYAALGSATMRGDTGATTVAGLSVATLGLIGTIGSYLVWRRRPRLVKQVGLLPATAAALASEESEPHVEAVARPHVALRTTITLPAPRVDPARPQPAATPIG